jgi:hypothetical protein
MFARLSCCAGAGRCARGSVHEDGWRLQQERHEEERQGHCSVAAAAAGDTRVLLFVMMVMLTMMVLTGSQGCLPPYSPSQSSELDVLNTLYGPSSSCI